MAGPAIVSLGEPLCEFSQLPGGEGRHYLQGFGGDTMNCAIAAARQGASVAYLTRLGDDDFGRQMLDLWRTEGVDATGVGVDGDAHTGVYFIRHGADGHVFSYLRKRSAASRMRPQDLSAALIEGARFLHTSGITQAISGSARDTVDAAMAIAARAGVQVVYDANLRLRLWPIELARTVIAQTVARADIFLLSVEDGEALSGSRDDSAILEWCRAAGAKRVALKRGAQGVVALDAAGAVELAGHRVECIDATGAGDCFAGALLARMAAGEEFRAALRYANAAAALATTGYGAIAPLPRPDAVRRLLGVA